MITVTDSRTLLEMRSPSLSSFFVFQGALYDRFGKRDLPPETKQDAISSGPLETTITKGCEGWHPRYDMSDGSFPRHARLGKKLFTKEFNLLAHRLIDIILELCVMN